MRLALTTSMPVSLAHNGMEALDIGSGIGFTIGELISAIAHSQNPAISFFGKAAYPARILCRPSVEPGTAVRHAAFHSATGKLVR